MCVADLADLRSVSISWDYAVVPLWAAAKGSVAAAAAAFAARASAIEQPLLATCQETDVAKQHALRAEAVTLAAEAVARIAYCRTLKVRIAIKKMTDADFGSRSRPAASCRGAQRSHSTRPTRRRTCSRACATCTACTARRPAAGCRTTSSREGGTALQSRYSRSSRSAAAVGRFPLSVRGPSPITGWSNERPDAVAAGCSGGRRMAAGPDAPLTARHFDALVRRGAEASVPREGRRQKNPWG
eukprot:scaffold8155_cov41-Phaeocystis_antarctica.AAC.2